MKKQTNIIIKIACIFLMLIAICPTIYAVATNINIVSDFGGTASTAITNTSGSIWATIVTIVQILAIGAIVFAGLKYMFSSADTKANIKKSTAKLAIGAGLVFASTTVIKIIADAGEEVL